MTNAERAAEYEEIAGEPFQRSPIEPPPGVSWRWWVGLAAVITVGSIVAVGIFKLLELMGL